jgi:hypothetical protein
VWLAVLCVACLALRSNWWTTDVFRDMDYYGYVVQGMLRGGLLYRDIDTDKPALLFYLLMPFIRACGVTSYLGMHLAASVGVVGTILATYWAGTRLGPRVGWLAAVFFAVYSLSPTMESFTPTIEHFMLPFTVSALALVLGRPSPKAAALAGICLGLATMVKQSALLLVAAAVFSLAGSPWAIAALLAAYLGSGLTYVGWLAVHGTFLDFWNGCVLRIMVYNGPPHYHQIAEQAGSWVKTQLTLWGAALPGLALLFRTQREQGRRMVWWLLVSCLATDGATFFFAHHFLLLLPLLCLLAAVVAAALPGRPVLLGLFALSFAWDTGHLVDTMLAGPAAAERAAWGDLFVQGTQLARWLHAHTEDGDTIYNWGVEWELYYASGRPSATRCINIEPLLYWASKWRADNTRLNRYFDEEQQRIWSEVVTRRPRYIVVTAPFVNLSNPYFVLPDAMSRYTQEQYVPATVPGITWFYVLRRKDS